MQEANKSEKDTQGVVISSTLSLSRDHLKKKKKRLKAKTRELMRDSVREVNLPSSPLGHYFHVEEEL